MDDQLLGHNKESDEVVLGRLAEEFLHQLWAGKRPTIEQFTTQHPEMKDLILEVFPTLLLATELDNGQRSPRLGCPTVDCTGELVPTAFAQAASRDQYTCLQCEETFELSPIRPDPGSISPTEHHYHKLADVESAIGRYAIKGGKLGEGGFGTVWLADDGTGWVALKVPRARPSAAQWRRYVAEVEAHRKLPPHPHVVQLKDYGKDGDTYFIVLDFKNAKPLAAVAPSSPSTSLTLMRRITSAVAHLHDHDIAHRDISPGNILIDKQSPDVPYLLDLGLAKCFHGNGNYEPDLTKTGQVVGSFRYMSPEQRQGEIGHDLCRSDVFSLGVVFYELLTGKYPFAGRTTEERIANKDNRYAKANTVTSVNPLVAKDLGKIVARCLVKNPRKRFANASQLAQALEQVSLDGAVMLSRRSVAAMILSMAAIGTIGIAWTFTKSRFHEAQPAQQTMPPTATIDNGCLKIDACGSSWPSLTQLAAHAAPDQAFEDLRGITLSNARISITDSDLQRANSLASLKFTECDLDWRVQQRSALTDLAFVGCGGFSKLDVSPFMGVRYLHLDSLPDVKSIRGFEKLSVECLAINGLPALAEIQGLETQTELRELELCGCPMLPANTIEVLRSFPLLRMLSICKLEMNDLAVLDNYQELQGLSICCMPGLSDLNALRKLPRLRKLNVASCENIAWSSLADLNQLEIFTDNLSRANARAAFPNQHIANGDEFWNVWRKEMIEERIEAGRYFDRLLD